MIQSKADSLKNEIAQPLEQITDKVESWWIAFVEMIPNMIVAIILFVIFYLLAKQAQKIFLKVSAKSFENKALENLFSTLIYFVVLGLGIFIILGVLQLDTAVASLLAGIGVVGLALGFAFQDIAANFVSGVILAFRKPYHIGDVVKIQDYFGKVVRTNLRVTVVLTFQGQEVYIPNKDVLSNPITNYAVSGERRIDLAVGVSYADDLKKVKQLVSDTILNMEGVIRHEDMIFTYKEFGDSSINFEIKFWIKYPDNPSFLELRSNAIMEIKAAFDREGITIPFPIRTLDFGIKGGKTLSEMKIGGRDSKGAS